MFVFDRKVRLGLALLAVVFLMTGCFGLFSNKPTEPDIRPTVLQGTVSGPAAVAASGNGAKVSLTSGESSYLALSRSVTAFAGGRVAMAASAVIAGETPLANVPVAVYKLDEFLADPAGAQPVLHGATDAGGKYTLRDMPKRVDLIVVVATTPRMTALVPAAGGNATADVNSATSLVAEAWAPYLAVQAGALPAADLQQAVAAVRRALDDLRLDAAGLADALDALVPGDFGDGLPAGPPADLAGLVQAAEASAPGYTPPTYTVSGRVVLADDSPLEGVVIQVHARGGSTRNGATTDAQGAFVIDQIQGDISLQPVLAGYVFDPATLALSGETGDIRFVASPVPAGTVVFADAAVDAAVRFDLNLGPDDPITPEDAARGKMISIAQGGVTSLAGVEQLVNLEQLNIYGNNPDLVDLSPIAGLSKLTNVDLNNTSVADISALGNKEHVSWVGIKGSLVEDVAPLGTLPGLRTLFLADSPVRDMSALSGLERLETVSVERTRVAVVPDLTALTQLDMLTLRDNPELEDMTALRQTTATWISLQDTPALDWCSWDDTWSIVDALRAGGARVDVSESCRGPYTLFGTVDTEAGAPYTPVVEVVLDGPAGSWTAYPDADGRWEQTVEGTVSMTLRINDYESTVWRFDPTAGRGNMTRPYGDLDFTAYASPDNIIEGYITDGDGNPLSVQYVMLQNAATRIVDATLRPDGRGYFSWTAPGTASYNMLFPSGTQDLVSSVPLPVQAPVRVYFIPKEDMVAVAIREDAWVRYFGDSTTLTAAVTGAGAADAAVKWEATGGTLSADTGRSVQWTAPQQVGTFVVTATATANGRTASATWEVEIVEPLRVELVYDTLSVEGGGSANLQAIVTGENAHRAEITWEASGGTFTDDKALATTWIAPRPSGTYDVSVVAFVPFQGGWEDVVAVEVEPHPVCVGILNCVGLETIEDVQLINDELLLDPAPHYVLANNIDAAVTATWGDGGFQPIGTESRPFTGTLDGGGHVVSGLVIDRPADINIGLFGYVGEGAHVYDVGLTNASVTARRVVGSLIGTNRGTVEDVYAFGDVAVVGLSTGTTVGTEAGGLIGSNYGSVTRVHTDADVTVTGAGGDVGGLIGNHRGGDLTDAYSMATVVGVRYVGGLVGVASAFIDNTHSGGHVQGTQTVGGLVGMMSGQGQELVNSFSTATVEGESHIGGLIGELFRASLHGSHSMGDVETAMTGANEYVGGLIGFANSATVTHSYSTGNVTGGNQVGGLVGNSRFTDYENVHSTGSVRGNIWVGGLLGQHETGLITDARSSGSVSGTKWVGGLTGWALTNFLRVGVEGTVTGETGVGGITGYMLRGNMHESYNAASVTGDENVGGLIGQMGDSISIKDSYNMGLVTGDENVGGIAGYLRINLSQDRLTLERVYAAGDVLASTVGDKKDVNGAVLGYASVPPNRVDQVKIISVYTDNQMQRIGIDGVMRKTSAEMKKESTYSGWGFGDIWDIAEDQDYPDLIFNRR